MTFACTDPLGATGQLAMDTGGALKLFLGKAPISAAHRKAVRLPHRINLHKIDPKPHVKNHPLDHPRLLKILSAEKHSIRLHNLEKLIANCCNTPEVARAKLTLERLRKALDVEESGVATLIYRLSFWNQDSIYPGTSADFQIFFQCPRVLLKVFRIVELRRIDENRHNGLVALLQTPLDQSNVTPVQRAHRRDEPYSPAPLDQPIQFTPIPRYQSKDSASEGNRPSRTSSAYFAIAERDSSPKFA